MIITDEKNIAQNQKEADGKSKKMLTFNFYTACMEQKTIKIEQKFFINNFSKTEKGQCLNIDLKLNIPSPYSLNKKEVCL